jgi:hypothetical protein
MTQQERSRAYYLKNRERIIAKVREYYQNNKEKHRECGRRWAEKNRDKVNADSRKYVANHPEKRAATVKRWQRRNRIKRDAHVITNNAIQGGHLIPMPCEVCGSKAQAHHDDYSRPLDVRWLCPKHHAEHHRKQASV